MSGDQSVAVRLLVAVAGADFSWTPGQEVDMPPEQAAIWADGVRGEYVSPAPAVETTDAQPRPRRRGRAVETT